MQELFMTKHAMVRAVERGGREDLREKVALAREGGIPEAEIAALITREHPDVVEATRAELSGRRALLLSRPGGEAILGKKPALVRVPLPSGIRAVVRNTTIVTFLPPARARKKSSRFAAPKSYDKERRQNRNALRFAAEVGWC